MPSPYDPPQAGVSQYVRVPVAHVSTQSSIYRSPREQQQQQPRPRAAANHYPTPTYSPPHYRRDSTNSDESDYTSFPSDRRSTTHRHTNSASTATSNDDELASATSPRSIPRSPQNGLPTQAKSSTEYLTVAREMNDSFEFYWMASLGRCVSLAVVASSSLERPQVITFTPGSWFHVYDAEGEIWPWVNLNGWIKGQLKESRHCVCAFQWFKNGKELGKAAGLVEPAVWKRPAVLREHLAHCQKLEPTDPLVVVARWSREGDKLKGGDTKPAPSRTGR